MKVWGKERRRFRLLWISWILFGVLIGAFAASGIRMTYLSRDAAQQLDAPMYIGLVSNLGALCWCVAAVIPLFTSFLQVTPQARRFLRWLACLSVVLLMDDMVMLHEEVFPKLLHLPEVTLYVFYLVYICVGAAVFWRFVFAETPWYYLVLGFAFMGMSVAIDINILPGGMDIEDGFKLLGITTYAFYGIVASLDFLAASAAPSRSQAG